MCSRIGIFKMELTPGFVILPDQSWRTRAVRLSCWGLVTMSLDHGSWPNSCSPVWNIQVTDLKTKSKSFCVFLQLFFLTNVCSKKIDHSLVAQFSWKLNGKKTGRQAGFFVVAIHDHLRRAISQVRHHWYTSLWGVGSKFYKDFAFQFW